MDTTPEDNVKQRRMRDQRVPCGKNDYDSAGGHDRVVGLFAEVLVRSGFAHWFLE